MKPKKPPKIRPLFTRILHPIFVFTLPIYHFILNFSYSLPENIFANFPRKALLCLVTAERKKERKEERKIKCCCTIPFISLARFRLQLNRLNKSNKIFYRYFIFSKYFKIVINHFMKCMKLGCHRNIVLRCAMHSTVRNYLEEATR